jgi:PAS domain S-box-containing protein
MNDLPDVKNRRILVIDDNLAIHDDFRKILSPAQSAGSAVEMTELAIFGPSSKTVVTPRFDVDSAYQGQEAVTLVKKALEENRRYAVAFVDVRMPPGWNGIETTEKIWEIDPDIQIVICTAYSDYSWEEMFEKLGQRDGLLILKKPFDAVEAFQLAHALTEKWRLLQQSRQKMEELETRVAGRTRELEQTNQTLQLEIAERKQAVEKLQESERRMRAITDSAQDAILMMDPKGTISYWNPAAERILGYASAEALGQNLHDLIAPARFHPAHLAAFAAFRQTGLGDAVGKTLDLEARRKDGVEISIQLSLSTVHMNGEWHAVGIIRDITRSKQAELEIQHQASFVRFNPNPVLELSSTGEITFFNEAAGAMTRELGRETPARILPPNTAEIVRECLASGTSKLRIETQIGHRVISWSFFPVKFNNTVHCYGGDITGRKRAQEALRASQQITEGIINAIQARVFWKDKNLVYLGCNAVFARDAGFADPKDLIGKDDYQMGWRAQAEKYRADDRQVIESGCSKLFIEEPQTTPEGNTITLLSSKIPLRNSKGEISGVIGTYMDITERKRLEARMFQSQKMETVGKLAGGIAHEFNSIMTAIIGQSELLLDDLPAGNPLRKNATEIHQAAERVAALTRQLLAYGRKQFLQPEALDLNQVIASMEGMFHHLMGEAVDVHIVPAPSLQAVHADAGQIEQVIMNMAMNARDAMPNGGILTLETANVTFDQDSVGRYPELKPGDYVMLAITDTGAGMSDAVKAHVFEPFFTTKGVGQGTGLGLSTCYGIIKQSGGHISVYSEPGRGAAFKIYLPQVEQPSKIATPRRDSPDLPRGTETILLVEDDPALREMAATLLGRLGYTVLAAANGVEALSLKQQPGTGYIDLLFTDVVMPHMSGKELADRVQALYPRTRILFTSAYTENAIVHQGVLDKGVALLQKPFTPSALARKLREVLDQPGAPKTDAPREKPGIAEITDGENTP